MDGDNLEQKVLQFLVPMQCLNNLYRKDLRRAYDVSEEFEEVLMNNKMYGVLTDGHTWVFVQYVHQY